MQPSTSKRGARPADDGAAVALEGVCAAYPEHGGARPADRLHGVSLSVRPGEIRAVLGPNGAGKSTLLRVMAGLLQPSAGAVRVLGDDAAALDRREMARRVALVAQRTEVALDFCVREVVAMGRAPHQGTLLRAGRHDDEVVAEALRRCELTDLAGRPVSTLSSGEQARVHIARAFAQRTPVLLLDEASAHLDLRHAVALRELVRAEVTGRGIACLAVMHDLTAAAQLASDVLLLRDGAVVADGPVDEVMTAARLGETFGVAVDVGTHPVDGRRYFLPARPAPAAGRNST